AGATHLPQLGDPQLTRLLRAGELHFQHGSSCILIICMKIQGIIVDTATPFDHAGELYRSKFQHNIEKWNLTSVSGYVIGGFAGEGALLSNDERLELWKIAKAQAAEGKLLLAGICASSVRESVALASEAAAAGYDAVLAEQPHYDPTVCACIETHLLFFRSLADRAPLPIVVSNRPAVSGLDLGPVAIVALSRHPNIRAVVDHSGDPARAVLSGDERILYESLRAGSPGGVQAFASAFPYALIALWEAFRTREEEAGLDWQARIAHPAELVVTRHGAAGLKHAMDLNGYYGGPPRLPSGALSAAARQEIAQAVSGLKGC
ncbi:MAG: dihydrodipicolinate synthase family protein, partial [Phycisphaerales bacterium]|nr:dihydrodipicolinate synthase family protein [Phycisphaerales bacterium]